MGGDHSPVRRGDGQEQKQTPKERGLLPGTKGLSRVMWVEIGQWGNVLGEGGLGSGEFCPRNAGDLRVPGSGFLKVSSFGMLGFSPGLPGLQKPGVEIPHGPPSGSVRTRPTRSKVGFQRSSLITACLKCVLLFPFQRKNKFCLLTLTFACTPCTNPSLDGTRSCKSPWISV